MSSKKCVLYDRKCTGCGECDMCDLDGSVKCTNCGKCIDEIDDFRSVNLEEFMITHIDKKELNKNVKRTGMKD